MRRSHSASTLVEVSVYAVLDQRDEIAFQAQQDDLGFRVAHAAIELKHLDAAIGGNHQSCVEKTGVAFAILRHAVYRRL